MFDARLNFRINMQLIKVLIRSTSADKVIQIETFILFTIYGHCFRLYVSSVSKLSKFKYLILCIGIMEFLLKSDRAV